ncbi:MAG: 2-aminoethylphosphonate aminotransferase [Candidatus Hodarchaeota archaeon]
MKKKILFTVGPVTVSENVRKALLCQDMVHREEEFYNLLTKVREKLVKIAGGNEEYTSVIFTGSGTASIEAVISSVYGKIFTIINGGFGKKIDEMARRYGIQRTSIDFGFNYPSLEEIEETLKNDDAITHIAIIHNETATGMLNPLHEVGELAKKYDKKLIVDAISSFGGHKLNVSEDNIGFCISGPNKCLESLPGVSFIIAKKALLEDLRNRDPRNLYLNLYNQYSGEEADNVPCTFAIQSLFALDAALDELLEEGLENRIKRYKHFSKILRDKLEKMGLQLLLPREQMSNVVTTVLLPENVSFKEIHDGLKERGFIIYGGKGSLADRSFRVGNMGALKEKDIRNFLSALEEVLNELKRE